jgi:DNA-binding NtrC family response regulator
MLSRSAFEIIEATGNRTAVRLLEQGAPPELVLIGVDLEGPDGLELLSYVHRKYPGTPVVLVASHPDGYSDAFKPGAVAVLKFPLPADLPRAVVAQAVGGEAVRPLKEALEEREREIIAGALEAFGGNRSETARAPSSIGRRSISR